MIAPMLRALTVVSLALSFTACSKGPRPTAEAAPEMQQAPASPLQGTPQKQPRPRTPESTVILDGAQTQVTWSDGDTFRIRSGPQSGTQARLHGYNTLEDYGPVHRWGDWTARELLEIAQQGGDRVRSGTWTCQSAGEKDRYQRLLVRCDDAGLTLVREGLAFAFSVEGPAPSEWQAAQQEARAQKRGMWAKGTPSHIISSVHSHSEGRGYNRVVDARTGDAQVREHEETYEVCQEVCVNEGEDRSCMTYVPFERRYKDKADCLR